MLGYISRRFLIFIPTLILLSMLLFLGLEAGPGDAASIRNPPRIKWSASARSSASTNLSRSDT